MTWCSPTGTLVQRLGIANLHISVLGFRVPKPEAVGVGICEGLLSNSSLQSLLWSWVLVGWGSLCFISVCTPLGKHSHCRGVQFVSGELYKKHAGPAFSNKALMPQRLCALRCASSTYIMQRAHTSTQHVAASLVRLPMSQHQRFSQACDPETLAQEMLAKHSNRLGLVRSSMAVTPYRLVLTGLPEKLMNKRHAYGN